jgi:hypothetical protein
MARVILIFGHGDTSKRGFPHPESLEEYIGGGIFRQENGRYRYSQKRGAEVIVLSRDGLAYGHFEIESSERPLELDRRAYPRAKHVYLVGKSVRYARPVRVSDLDISRYQFGKQISEEKFAEILELAGPVEEFHP